MMNYDQLQQLAALDEAATPGRWIAEPGMGVRLADYTPICMAWSETCEPVNVDANMAFIAAARQAVPELLAEVADLRREFEQERVEIGMLRRQVAEERMRASAAEFAVAQLRDEAAELRRQLMAVTIDRNQLRLLWIEYRQRLADTTAEIADLRQLLDRERLAAIQHAIWSHWMTYQSSVCLNNNDGTMTIPADRVARWERQASTPYSRLPESERESDRHQADRILADDSPATGEGDA